MKTLILAITIALSSNTNVHIQETQAITQQTNVYKYHDIGRWYIEEGDTLQEVATFYSNDTHNVNITIDIIKGLNNLENDNIQGLEYVIIPLYDNIDWWKNEF